MALVTTNYSNIAGLVEENLKQIIISDLRKRLVEVATKEIDDIVVQVAGDIVASVSEARSFSVEGLTVQVAVNGVRKDAS
jgi:rRNA pseudouridine-1189 N-methylase Emg1 (Nep1/Mra1 family)